LEPETLGENMNKKIIVIIIGLILILLLVAAALNFRRIIRKFRGKPPRTEEKSRLDGDFRLGDLIDKRKSFFTFDPSAIPSTEWIRRYDPERADNGYHLELYRGRVPILMDMNGNIVLMIERGYPGEGNILVFDNGLKNLYRYRESAILEIVPPEKSLAWVYRDEFFFSSQAGTAQALPNGNVVITSSRGGRIFEINRTGEIVWEYVPPYLPIRSIRYPYDYCPQFAGLGKPSEIPVVPAEDLPHVDRELYQYDARNKILTKNVDGESRLLVKALGYVN
jgi:hypothetical protein